MNFMYLYAMRFFVRLILLLFLLQTGSYLYGQTPEEPAHMKMAVVWHHSVTYTAYSSAICFSVKHRDWQVYAGPRLLLNDMYTPAAGPWGVQLGVNYFPLRGERTRSFISIDYQNVFFKPYNPHAVASEKNNSVHEFNLAYGFQRFFSHAFGVSTKIGFGRYTERFHDLGEGVVRNYAGYSGLLNIGFFYEF